MLLEQRQTCDKKISNGNLLNHALALAIDHGQQLSALAASYERQIDDLRANMPNGTVVDNNIATTKKHNGFKVKSLDLEDSGEHEPLQDCPASEMEEIESNSTSKASDAETTEVLSLWPEWDHHQLISSDRAFTNQDLSVICQSDSSQYMASKVVLNTLHDKVFVKCFLILPTSRMRICWDILSMCVLAYDAFTFPLSTFDYDKLPIAARLGLVTTTFWSLDIYFSFVSAHYKRGVLQARFHKIAAQYLRTWFAPDIIIVSADWLMILVGSDDSSVDILRLGKSFRVLRVIRLLRLLRVLKAFKVAQSMGEVILQNIPRDVVLVVDIGKFILAIVLVNHFIACMWHASSVGVPGGWLEHWNFKNDNPSMLHQYVAAFHWSVCQFTPAPVTIHPRNLEERLFAIVVLLFGISVFSSFLGTITSILTQTRKVKYENSLQQEFVNRYLVDNKISLSLGNHIMSLVQAHLSKQRWQKPRLRQDDVVHLKILPKLVTLQLNFEVYVPVLVTHPFLSVLRTEHTSATLHICQHAMAEQSFSEGHEIFSAGHNAEGMMFFVCGSCTYALSRESSTPPADDKPIILGPGSELGSTLCEVALWIAKWKHKGHLLAGRACFTMRLLSSEFRQVAIAHPGTMKDSRRYARKYLRSLNELAEMQPIDDRGVEDDIIREVVRKLSDNLIAGTRSENDTLSNAASTPSFARGSIDSCPTPSFAHHSEKPGSVVMQL